MFALIESDHRPGFGWSGKLTSLGAHAVLILAAAMLSRAPAVAPQRPIAQVDVFNPPAPPSVDPPPATASIAPAPGAFPRVIPAIVPPVDIPTELPPPGAAVLPNGWDSVTHVAIAPSGNGTLLLSPDQPRDVRVVDEPPLLVSHPAIRYPETLRQAGIEGRVIVETVLDTLGRAESSLTRVTTSAAEPFNQEAIAVVLASHYRPARVAGRAVRVRIAVPVSFSLR